MAEKDKEPKNIEEVIRGILKNVSDEDKKNIEAFERHYKRGNQAKIERMAFDAFQGNARKKIAGAYDHVVEAMEAVYKGGKVAIDSEDNIHRVAISYMKGFFQNAKPSVLKALEEAHPELKTYLAKSVSALSKDEAKKLYEALADKFDHEVGVGVIKGVRGLSDIVEELQGEFSNEDEVNTDMIGEYFKEISATHAAGVAQKVNIAAHTAYIANLPQGAYAAYIHKKMKKRGHDFKKAGDAAKFFSEAKTPAMAIAQNLHVPLIQKKYDQMKPQAHGLYAKETKETEKD